VSRWSALLLCALPTLGLAAEGGEVFTFFQADKLEYRSGDEDAWAWEAQGWVGGDFNKLWLKAAGEKIDGGDFEKSEVQVLYSRLLSNFFDLQMGFRHDFEPEPERSHLVLGLEGLAPYYFEVNASAFLSDEGEFSARLEGEYELLFTSKLILQPTLELEWYGSDVAEREIQSGFTDVELGLRLRYEIVREIAPYVGLHWERKLGDTADLARDEGEGIDNLFVVAGLRLWF